MEEATITDTLGIVFQVEFPLARYDVKMLIGKYLRKQGNTVRLFKYNIPGDFHNSFIAKTSRASVDNDDVETNEYNG